jgi:hypothetical protein
MKEILFLRKGSGSLDGPAVSSVQVVFVELKSVEVIGSRQNDSPTPELVLNSWFISVLYNAELNPLSWFIR